GMDRMHEIAAILELARQIPSELIVLDGEKYAELQYGIAAASTALDVWKTRGDCWSLTSVPAFRNLNPIKLIYDALAKCPDEFPAMTTAGLAFINDADIRSALRLDLSAVNVSLANGEWKAATVLGGSLCEALLFWKLRQQEATNV